MVAIEDAESGQKRYFQPRSLDVGNEFRLCLWKYVGAIGRVDFEKFSKVANGHSGCSVCYTNYEI